MVGWERQLVLRFLAGLLSIIAVVWLALWYFIPAPPHELTIAAGIPNGAFSAFAEHYRERLAREHIKLNVRTAPDAGPAELKIVEDPKSGVDAAFLFGGTSDSTRSPGIMSLGRINFAPIWIFYRDSETINRLTELKGKRISVALGAFGLVEKILAPHGVTRANTTLTPKLGPEAIKALKDDEADVAILPPQDIHSPIMQPVWSDPGLRLMNLSQAETLARLFPNLNHLVLTQGAVDLERNIPATDVNLIATTNVVVVRKDLHPELIYLLATTMKEEHSGATIFSRAGEFPTQTDPEYPMAEEAVDYYRNGPSFLHRYLPFWMINYTKRIAAILIAAVAVVIPVFTYAPKLYDWLLQSYMKRLYRRLRAGEVGLEDDLTASQLQALQADLENISRAAKVVPMRHSDHFFALIMHIDLTRSRLASRLVT